MTPAARYSKRIDITAPAELIRRIDISARRYDFSRSAVIRWALHEWFERHSHTTSEKTEPKSGKIDTEQAFHEYIKPDMTPDELLNMLQAYEIAQNDQV